ncbi:unnamed protein product, partial [Lampetra planeri]
TRVPCPQMRERWCRTDPHTDLPQCVRLREWRTPPSWAAPPLTLPLKIPEQALRV